MLKARAWQVNAVNQCVSMAIGGSDRALVFACPGSGKTIAGLLIAIGLRERTKIGKGRKVIVLTPNLAIKSQWIERSCDLGLNLVAIEDARVLLAGVDDMFSGGFIITYQQAISMRASLRLFCDTHKPIAILDEVHHTSGPAGERDGNEWGVSILHSLAHAAFKLATTGTPFRQGSNPIAFVNYNDDDRAHAHVEYGYKQAILDRICRPIVFEIYDGMVEWTDAKGISYAADFNTPLTKSKRLELLRAAVSIDGQFPLRMFEDAHKRLLEVRAEPGGERSGGLVVAMNVQHAEAIADALTVISGTRPVVVHNKVDDSLDLINAFRDGDALWIVGIKMLSEGVDIPRLRVGVYCTNIQAALYFHQFCGRMTRVQSNDLERAYVFMPGAAELQVTARQIETDVAHALGEDVPIREPSGRRRGRSGMAGILIESSNGANVSSIGSGHVVPVAYIREHESTIREYRDTPGLRNLTQVELVIVLVRTGVLPPFQDKAA